MNDQAAQMADGLQWVEHPSGLMQGVVNTSKVRGRFFLLGGHVAEYQPAGAEPVLFMSEAAVYQEGQAIRGGVPICFPWFGPKKDSEGNVDPSAPAHGLARTELWDFVSSSSEDEVVRVVLEKRIEHFHLTYTLGFGDKLTMCMEVVNTSDRPQESELALHTYFSVAEASQVQIKGLEGLEFLDQLTGTQHPPSGAPVVFREETDRIYHGQPGCIVLEDPKRERAIQIQSQGSRSTVVWNPWIAKSQRMPDFGDDEYPGMCCIETAAIRPNHLQIPAGGASVVQVEIGLVAG